MESAVHQSSRARRAHVVDREVRFDIEELFFSTTDTKGFIRGYNEVFVRVAGYSPSELAARPHNILRHPDMPKVVFRLLWETIQGGQPIAAYVKNRAKDGSYYWVLATVQAIPGGYISVRLKPSTTWFDAIGPIYDELLDLEQRVEGAGGSRDEAMDAAQARLLEHLAAAGFGDYGEFTRAVLVDEVLARKHALESHPQTRARSTGLVAGACSATAALRQQLGAELERIGWYADLNRELANRSLALVRLADEGKNLAINAVLAARRLGSDGNVLATVAELMKQTFPEVAAESRQAVDCVDQTRRYLAQVGCSIALAALQNDVADVFFDEVAALAEPAEALGHAAVLAACLRADVDAMRCELGEIERGLDDIRRSTVALNEKLDRLRAIERSGRVEAARTTRAGSFETLFEHTQDRVEAAREQTVAIAQLAAVADRSVSAAMIAHLDRLDAAITAESARRDASSAPVATAPWDAEALPTG